MQPLTPSQAQLAAAKQRLGLRGYRTLGLLEAALSPDSSIQVRFRGDSDPVRSPSDWEACVEIPIGSLWLQMAGVLSGDGTLFYTRVGSRPVRESKGAPGEFLPAPGLELILIAADAPPRSATTSRSGQAIFPLTLGLFTLLLPTVVGGEIQIAWLSAPSG